ncbi:MAG: DDE-type integrase/transposase/recombinase [Candidatus Lokiarchaeota archaeon]|nr:DDE-type integrase/transposase/recombinase [Candidatus Lokiarchaeota archaeon]
MNKNIKTKIEKYGEARELHYNKGLSIASLAERYGRSERTIYRWLRKASNSSTSNDPILKRTYRRRRKYPKEIFDHIIEIKQELPQRSAPMVHRRLKMDYPESCPSLSTIQKFIREQGLVYRPKTHSQGYMRFQREKPNDLWQIDIAGVQTVGHLGQVYLIALVDDYSRFIPGAEYFRTQKGTNALKVIRDAVLAFGRPNEILADNGTQFKNILGELGTKYSRFLDSLGIKPIFARPRHPQTKGKLERFFYTVIQMYLVEARSSIKTQPNLSLAGFNEGFKSWVDWYNTEKPHNALPNKITPRKIYFNTPDRFYRPLETHVNWDKWLQETQQRKVTKYNTISYKSQEFSIPPGYVRAKVDVIEYEDKLEIFHKDRLLVIHPYNVPLFSKKSLIGTRRIRKNGTISYRGKSYSIDYKLARKMVEIQESNGGRELLVYLDKIMIANLKLS